jgi:hypothetical protein
MPDIIAHPSKTISGDLAVIFTVSTQLPGQGQYTRIVPVDYVRAFQIFPHDYNYD